MDEDDLADEIRAGSYDDDAAPVAPVERDRAEHGRIERDGVERDGVERDGVERDGVERDGVERDGVERDGVERDGVERSAPERRARKVAVGGALAGFGALKVAVVFLLLGGGVAFLLWGTEASDAFVYSKLVDEVMREPDRFRGRELRVEGQLVRGSVVFQAEPSCEHRFVLTRRGQTMPVRFPRCVVPDTFRDDVEMDVVVQGQLQADNSFLANEVIPRCPSKYEMRQRREDGEEMPHVELPPGGERT